ncbi:nucleotidyltransferase family protein [Kytococcus sedentarius]|nr:nucleotidyltransferase family protein [Kytococcus sedentarius]
MSDGVSLSAAERVLMAHAAASYVLRLAGLPFIVIKGPVGRSLIPSSAGISTDVDILIDPHQEAPSVAALQRAGWQVIERSGRRAARHATILAHPVFGVYLDLHSYFPGIGASPERAFADMWTRRRVVSLAGQPINVPDTTDHILVLVLHSVRSGPSSLRAAGDAIDYRFGTDDEPLVERARSLDALGVLSLHPRFAYINGRPGYYWRLKRRGVSGLTQWCHRVVTAPSFAEALKEARAALAVNPLRGNRRAPLSTVLSRAAADITVIVTEGLTMLWARRGRAWPWSSRLTRARRARGR